MNLSTIFIVVIAVVLVIVVGVLLSNRKDS